ncbi:MAG: beta strand repeat-containing protein [Candidatus Brocadiia bacterium]
MWLMDDAGRRDPLGALVTSHTDTARLQDVITQNRLDVNASRIKLDDTTYRSNYGRVYLNGPVDLSAGGGTVSVSSGGGSGDDITLNGRIADPGSVHGILLNAGPSGNVSLKNVTANGKIDVNGDNIYLNGTTYTSSSSHVIFDGTTKLQSGSTLTVTGGGGSADDIVFTGPVDDPGTNDHLRLVAGSGDVDLQSAAGANSALGSLTVTSSSATDLHDVYCLGPVDVTADGTWIRLYGDTYRSINQSLLFNGNTVLFMPGGATNILNGAGTGDDIIFKGNIEDASGGALTLTAGDGNVELRGVTGGRDKLGALNVTSATRADLADIYLLGSMDVTAGDIRLTGNTYQSNSGSFRFDGHTHLYIPGDLTTITTGGGSGDDVTFAGLLDDAGSNDTLSLAAGDGDVVFQDTAGSNSALGSLEITSANTAELRDVFTIGANDVTADNIHLHGTSYNSDDGTISFTGPVDLNAGGAVGIDSDADNDGTDGDISFSDSIALSQNLTLDASGGNIALDGAVDGNNALVLNSTGTTDINGPMGGTTPLASLTTNAGGTTELGNDIFAQGGAITFNDPVLLDGDITLSDTGNIGITFHDFVDAADDGTAGSSSWGLTVDSPNGATTFEAEVGGGSGNQTGADDDGLQYLIVSSANQVDVLDVTTTGTQSITGANINLNGTSYNSFGDLIRFAGATNLHGGGNTVTVQSGGGAGDDITFTGLIDDPNSNDTLDLIAGAGDVNLQNAVGGNSALGLLRVSSANVADLNDISVIGVMDITAGGIGLNGTTYLSATDSLRFAGNTDLHAGGNTITVQSGGSSGDDITFTGLIDDPNSNDTLDLIAGAGDVNLQNAVGGNSALGGLTISSAGTAELQDLYTVGTVDLRSDNIHLDGATYRSGGLIRFAGATSLRAGGNTITVQSGGGVADDVTFAGLLDDAGSNDPLILEAGAGDVTFGNTVGANDLLNAMSITAAHINVAGGIVHTMGKQSYVGTIALSDSAASSGVVQLLSQAGDIEFNTAQNTPLDIAMIYTPVSGTDVEIDAGGDMRMTQNDKMTVLGDLRISAGNTASIGDLNTQGEMNVGAKTIQLLSRAEGPAWKSGTSLTTDKGVDYVGWDGIHFTGTVKAEGGDTPLFASSSSEKITGVPTQFMHMTLEEQPVFPAVGSLLVDLVATGNTQTNLATGLPGPLPYPSPPSRFSYDPNDHTKVNLPAMYSFGYKEETEGEENERQFKTGELLKFVSPDKDTVFGNWERRRDGLFWRRWHAAGTYCVTGPPAW